MNKRYKRQERKREKKLMLKLHCFDRIWEKLWETVFGSVCMWVLFFYLSLIHLVWLDALAFVSMPFHSYLRTHAILCSFSSSSHVYCACSCVCVRSLCINYSHFIHTILSKLNGKRMVVSIFASQPLYRFHLICSLLFFLSLFFFVHIDFDAVAVDVIRVFCLALDVLTSRFFVLKYINKSY